MNLSRSKPLKHSNKVMVLDDGDKRFKAMLGLSTRDNHISNNLTLTDYLVLKECEVLYRLNNQLSPELFDLLTIFVKLFTETRKAITSYALTKLTNRNSLTGCNIMNTRQKLTRLVDRGYAEIIGKSAKCILYIPTERAYKELSELIKQ